MRNSKGKNLGIGLVAILVAAVFAPTLVHAKDYTVGVKAGDWVKYGQFTVTWTGNGTEPSDVTDRKKLDWARIDVISVADTTASLNFTLHYNNGTQTFQSYDIDIQSGALGGLFSVDALFLVASNLTLGDPVSPQTPETTINQTVTRLYAGANRNVNILDSQSSYPGYQSQYTVYWDQNTGIMVELHTSQPYYLGQYEVWFKVTETNMWSTNALDLLQNNLIYIIAGIVVIIAIVAATIVFRRRKPAAPQQPPPPSAPPPPPS